MSRASDFAASLSGNYPFDLPKAQAEEAKELGLVVVFGASDDLMEFRGAICDELGAYDGTTAYLTPDGLLSNDCESDECPHFEKMKKRAATIDALWCEEGGISWTFRTRIPHATFVIYEDGEQYCRGIVFALSDATTPEQTP